MASSTKAKSILRPNVQQLLSNNHSFIQNFKPLPTIAQYAAILAANPDTSRLCIITCCDPRVVPESIFGLNMGEAIVMRTVGGSIEPALAGMLAIDSVGPLTDIVIMRHTDCGTAKWTDEGVKKVLIDRCGDDEVVGRRGENLVAAGFGESVGDQSYGDERLLREDVEWLKASPVIRKEMKGCIVGMMYNTGTGEVKVIC